MNRERTKADKLEAAAQTDLPNHGRFRGAKPACFVPKRPSGVYEEFGKIVGSCVVCNTKFEFVSGKGWFKN